MSDDFDDVLRKLRRELLGPMVAHMSDDQVERYVEQVAEAYGVEDNPPDGAEEGGTRGGRVMTDPERDFSEEPTITAHRPRVLWIVVPMALMVQAVLAIYQWAYKGRAGLLGSLAWAVGGWVVGIGSIWATDERRWSRRKKAKR